MRKKQNNLELLFCINNNALTKKRDHNAYASGSAMCLSDLAKIALRYLFPLVIKLVLVR